MYRQKRKIEKMKDNHIEFILKYFEYDNIKLIDAVLADNKDDSDYSIEEYLWDIGYSKNDILEFTKLVEKESKKYKSELKQLDIDKKIE